MKDERWLDPVDPGSTTTLDRLVGEGRDPIPPIVPTSTLTMARYSGDFETAALTLDLELAAQRISVLHRYQLSPLLAVEGVPIAQRAVVFDVWSADAAAALMARDPAHAAYLPWCIAVVERGDDVLLLMPRRSPAFRPDPQAVDAGRRWTDRLQACISHVVRTVPLMPGVHRP